MSLVVEWQTVRCVFDPLETLRRRRDPPPFRRRRVDVASVGIVSQLDQAPDELAGAAAEIEHANSVATFETGYFGYRPIEKMCCRRDIFRMIHPFALCHDSAPTEIRLEADFRRKAAHPALESPLIRVRQSSVPFARLSAFLPSASATRIVRSAIWFRAPQASDRFSRFIGRTAPPGGGATRRSSRADATGRAGRIETVVNSQLSEVRFR
jgi:hypothetical protein